jgi:hypothetical protein
MTSGLGSAPTELDLFCDTGHRTFDGSRLVAMKMTWGEIFGL